MSIVSTNMRVKISGQLVATVADQFPIAGCPFYRGDSYSPCIMVWWVVPASRVFVNQQPVILKTSTGLGLNAAQLPQGPPTVVSTQVRVRGT